MLLCLSAAPGLAIDTSIVNPPLREVLPRTVAPLHYDLGISPDAGALTFRGRVKITVEVREKTTDVVLNAVRLNVDRAGIDGAAATTSPDDKLGRITLHVNTPLDIGRHVMSIDYHGNIGKSTLGFFAMDYASSDGPRRTLATNFEPAAARELFPCWDEPGRKATFTVSVDAPKDRLAFSNMPVDHITSLSDALQRIQFAETPRMSTYLVFLAIGDFERVHRQVDGVDVGIVVKRGDLSKAAYALDQAASLLHYYNDYFGIAYPLPKLDLIAAPGQIEGGSMENWGAIFYSQNHLLFDPAASTEADRQVVFRVVSHEMAHQWFGDLVTMAWWDNLWLNEGFARWMQTFAADDLHPEWQTGLQAAAIFERGKNMDASPSTHPVVQEVLTADQASQSFDSITYDKGAAIITMTNAYLGRDTFRKGVRHYMRSHAYGNTVDDDLWFLMQQTAGKPIRVIEQDFTRQEGLPLVRAAAVSTGVRLTQSRFVDDSKRSTSPAQQWRLPLAIGPVDGAKRSILMRGNTSVTGTLPLLVNAGQLGYTRVLYSAEMMAALARRMRDLSPIDQLGLLDDQLAFAYSGDAPASDVLNLALEMPADGNAIVWRSVIALLRELDRSYSDGSARDAFHHFALRLLAPLAERIDASIGAETTPTLVILRSTLEELAGKFGDTQVLTVARQRWASGSGTPAQLRSALSIVAAGADPATFDALLERALKATDPLEKQHLFLALAAVSDPALARRMVDVALSDQIPAGSGPSMIGVLAEEHADLVWAVVAPRLDDPSLPFDAVTRWRLATSIASQSTDSQRIIDLESYETRSVPVESRRPFLAAVADIRNGQRFKASALPEVDRWIASHSTVPATAQNGYH